MTVYPVREDAKGGVVYPKDWLDTVLVPDRNWPALLALVLVPLVVGAKPVVFGEESYVDFFSWYKSALVVLLGAIAAYRRLPPIYLVLPVVVSSILSHYPGVVWTGFPAQYLGGIALLALFALAANPPSERDIVKALTYGSIPISLFALLPSLLPWRLIAYGYDVKFSTSAAASTLYNANYVGLYVATVFPVLFVKRREGVLICVAIVLLLLALVESKSLSGFGATAIGGVIVYALEKRVLTTIALSVVVIATLAVKWKPGFSGRLEIWGHAFPLISTFGSGLGSFALEYPQVVGETLVDKPHSLYFQIAHAFGWLGLSAFILGLISWRPKVPALAVGVVGFLVAGFCNDFYIGVAPIAMILFGASNYGPRK